MNPKLMTDPRIGKTTAPLPLIPEVASPTAYPITALSTVMQDAVLAIVEHEQVPAAIAGQCVIGAATHLAQTRINAWHPKGRPGGAPCSLFMLSLFASGEGKSSARKLAFKTIDEAEKEARNRHRQQHKEIEEMSSGLKGKALEQFMANHPLPANPQTQYSDATFEPLAGEFIRGKPAASWDTDEGGQMLGGSSFKAETVVATLGGLTKGFDDGHFERTRSRGNQEGSGVAYNRRLSIHLLAQPVAVAEALSNPLMTGQGFLARFLLAAPESLAGTRLITLESLERSAYADPRLQRYWQRCNEISNSPEFIDQETGEVQPPVLEPAPDAKKVWVIFRNKIEAERGPLGHYAGLKPFAARGAEQALRLAAVLGLFEGVSQITADCMSRACALVDFSLAEWLRYTEVATINPDLKMAADLMSWLRDSRRSDKWREFHINDLGKSGPSAIRSAKTRDRILAILVEHHYLLTADGKQFRINPSEDVADTADSAETAENAYSHGKPPADNLRKIAETKDKAPLSVVTATAFPQPSANLPHAQTLCTPGFPQNPQYPQPNASVIASQDYEEF